jgi:hypothetical protein
VRAAALLAIVGASLAIQAQSAGRFVGTITAVSGNTLTVKTDTGEEKQVQVEADAVLKQLAPGQKDLASASTIALSDLAVGDRVLVRLDPAATGGLQANQVVAMKQSDVAQKQQQERDEWQKRGVGGIVKSVDAANGTILVSTGAGPTAKNVAVKTSSSTTLLRYAPGSVRFADAKAAPLSEVKPGDQLRAKGAKNTDGTEVTAEQVVSGTFRNVSGLIASTDGAAGTITLKDLTTKKNVTIHVAADTQMHRMPDTMAKMLAARLNGTMPSGGFQRGAGGAAAGGANAGSGAPGGPGRSAMGGSAMGGSAMGGSATGGSATGGGFGGDPAQMLNRLPAVKLADLQKGEAVMVVASDGTTDVNAITLLAGVEPLLEAPAAKNLLSNWSMGGGGAEGAGAQ